MPLGRVVVDELAAHLAAYGPAPDGSIFIDEQGRALIYTAWKPLWKAAGAGYKTHDLRHYAASATSSPGASSTPRLRTVCGPTRRPASERAGQSVTTPC